MKTAPAPQAIHEAELRFIQSSRNVGEGLHRARLAFRSSMAGPSVLLKVAGASGLLCFWLARRGRSRRGYPVTSLWDTAVTSARGLMLALILRYGRTRLGAIFR